MQREVRRLQARKGAESEDVFLDILHRRNLLEMDQLKFEDSSPQLLPNCQLEKDIALTDFY